MKQRHYYNLCLIYILHKYSIYLYFVCNLHIILLFPPYYDGRVNGRKRKATVWCLFVCLSVSPIILLRLIQL